jgi:hypothetical protein
MEGLRAVERSGSTDDGLPLGAPRSFEQPPEGLPGGGRHRPAIVALAIAAVVGLLVWQPWGPGDGATVAPGSPTPPIARTDASRSPSPSTGLPRAPAATPATGVPSTGSPLYVSLTDNEWTVVALLTPGAPSSSEEPATQHDAGAPWSPAGPFLVLQQGLIPVATPVEGDGDAGSPCITTGVPRDRTAVPLPAGRVAYLGVTVPGTVPRAEVTVEILGRPSGTVTRATSPTVQLAGMNAGQRYVIPSSGPGGAILFGPASPGPLPPGAYRFEVASPGAVGNRYLYACIAP